MNKYMEAAFSEARIGMYGAKGGPFGAVIVKDGKMISAASNEALLSSDPTARAGITTTRKACQKLHIYDLTGCTLNSTGEPCPTCLSAIIWANIKIVHYACSADLPYQYYLHTGKVIH